MKFCIDAGHGDYRLTSQVGSNTYYYDSGCASGIYEEAILATDIRDRVASLLKGYVEYYIPLRYWNTQTRYTEAIKNKCTHYIVLHLNSGPAGSNTAFGTESYWNPQGKDLANDLIYYLNKDIGFKTRWAHPYQDNPRSIAAFDIATIPFVLLEICFLTTNSDLKIFLANKDYIAQSIAGVIFKYANLERIQLTKDSLLASKGNSTVKLLIMPQEVNGRIMVGIRDIGNLFGCQVLWHPNRKTVTLIKK